MLHVPSMEGLGAIVYRGAHCARRLFDLGALGNHCSKRLVASRSVRALASCAMSGGTHCGNWTSVTAWRPDGVCSSRTWVSCCGGNRSAKGTGAAHKLLLRGVP